MQETITRVSLCSTLLTRLPRWAPTRLAAPNRFSACWIARWRKRDTPPLVAACEGSDVAGRLFPVPRLERVTFNDPERRWYTRQLKAEIDRALLLHCVDIVHMHGLDFYSYDFPPGIPVLVTLHMPIAWYGPERA